MLLPRGWPRTSQRANNEVTIMLQPRWHKVLSDLRSNKTRTLLVVLSISVGVFAVGLVTSMYYIFVNDMDAAYQAVNPHHATVYTSPFDQQLLNAAQRVPGVAQVEGRSGLNARVEVKPGNWQPIGLTAIGALSDTKIDQIRPVGAVAPLRDRQIYIERASLALLAVKEGETVRLQLPDKSIRTLTVAGIVHDVNAMGVIFSGRATAYVNPNTMQWLGGSRDPNTLYITVAQNTTNEAHVKAVAQEVTHKVESSGRTVYATIVIRPGEHPVRFIVQTLLMVMAILGVLLTFLSGFLIINTINALMNQHIRQIGVMKAVGAQTGQIVGIYLALVTTFGILALLLSAPLGAYVGYRISVMMAGLINFDLGPFRLTPQALLLEAAVAVLVPVISSLYPVLHGTRITIREAISSYGLGRGQYGRSLLDRMLTVLGRIPLFSRPVLISIRNTFRRKARLALTLSTLTLAGAIFIAVFNVSAAFDVTIQETLGYYMSDVNLTMNRNYRIQQIDELARDVPGITHVEGWSAVNTQALSADKQTSVECILFAPPAGSPLIRPVMTSGRWLLPADENAIVIGNHMVVKRPDLKVGDPITMRMFDKDYSWRIVGIYRMAGNAGLPILYANAEYLNRLLGQTGQAGMFRMVTSQHDPVSQSTVAKALEQKLNTAGLRVGQVSTGAEEMARQAAQTNILTYFLLTMAVLIALVGGIGLMGTMSMNVLERTREIGVLRSIGASNGSILQLVVVEGMMIGILSWVLGMLLSLPLSKFMCDVVGVAFVTLPLTFVFSMNGVLPWLIIVLVLSAVASVLPAWNAVRLTVRDVLAYE
jgi:putative ABC transport system permease protein